MIDPELLSVLRCPLHPEGPPFTERDDLLICEVGRHAFRVVDGIPHLLPEDAIPLDAPAGEEPSDHD